MASAMLNELLGSSTGCVLVLVVSWMWSPLQPCPYCIVVMVATLGLRAWGGKRWGSH